MRVRSAHRAPAVLVLLLIIPAGCAQEQADIEADDGSGVVESSSTLFGNTWEWVETVTPVERFAADDPERYSITLSSDGSVSAQFDCNGGQGTYAIDEHRIEFGVFAATRMACPDDTQDFVFESQLGEVSTYFIQDGQLFLELPFDSGTMRFRAASAMP